MSVLTHRADTSSVPDGDLLLEISDLQVDFKTDAGWIDVVQGVSLGIARGEVLGLVGESGSGKSVTCLSILGLLPRNSRISAGSVRFGGIDLVSASRRELEDVRGRDISMIFQEPMTSLNPALTVGRQVGEVIRRHTGASKDGARQRTIELLDQVGIPSGAQRLGSYPHEFSGGMRQRVMIAIALACRPKLIIADEPTTALDVTVQAQVLDLLREVAAEEGASVLFVTHDLGVVADICDRVVVMYAGKTMESADVDDLYAAPQHPYTEGLLRSMPQLVARDARLQSIGGSPPAPGEIESGCRFAPRCDYVEPLCREEEIVLTISGRSLVRCRRAEQLHLEGAP